MPKIVFEAIKKNFSRDGEHGWKVLIDGVAQEGTVHNRDFDIGTNTMVDIFKKAGVEIEFDFDSEVSDAHDLFIDLVADMDYALRQFGEYTFRDKGPQEVMDVDGWIEKLRGQDHETVIELLLALAKHSKHGERLVSCLLIDMQDWDELFENEELAEMM